MDKTEPGNYENLGKNVPPFLTMHGLRKWKGCGQAQCNPSMSDNTKLFKWHNQVRMFYISKFFSNPKILISNSLLEVPNNMRLSKIIFKNDILDVGMCQS